MVRSVHQEQSEITLDYMNLPDESATGNAQKSSSGKDGGVPAAVPGRKLYRLVAVSFGLLCILQAALNIYLRLTLYNSENKSCCKNMTEETDELQKKLTNFDQYFQNGWVYFHPSFYYISIVEKTWNESRDDCLQRGADLIIINSKREQDFTRKLHKVMWLGLTRGEIRDRWNWVDGSPLIERFSYWLEGEPNGFEGKNEDCVETNFEDKEYNWNDIPCENMNFWICEKVVAL